MKLLEIIHPAAKTLVDISLSQDAEVTYLCEAAAAYLHNKSPDEMCWSVA